MMKKNNDRPVVQCSQRTGERAELFLSAFLRVTPLETHGAVPDGKYSSGSPGTVQTQTANA